MITTDVISISSLHFDKNFRSLPGFRIDFDFSSQILNSSHDAVQTQMFFRQGPIDFCFGDPHAVVVYPQNDFRVIGKQPNEYFFCLGMFFDVSERLVNDPVYVYGNFLVDRPSFIEPRLYEINGYSGFFRIFPGKIAENIEDAESVQAGWCKSIGYPPDFVYAVLSAFQEGSQVKEVIREVLQLFEDLAAEEEKSIKEKIIKQIKFGVKAGLLMEKPNK